MTPKQPKPDDEPWVSTGHLPAPDQVEALVALAHQTFRSNGDGQTAALYPALAAMPSALFGVCFVTREGRVHASGDCDQQFTLMSVSKPLVFALLCQALGPRAAQAQLGVNATGLPFNALAAIEQSVDGRTNPLVNPGAITAASLVPGVDQAARWGFVLDGLSRFAGRPLSMQEEIYTAAIQTNFRNQSIAKLLQAVGRLHGDPVDAIDLYTRQCSLLVTARDLAAIGATLANGGVNPLTHQRVVDADTCRHVLAVMTTAGFYEASGDWLYEVGLPGKSGIGGGIVAVAPGKGGLGTFAPPLDPTGTSVKGQLAAKFLSERLGLNLFASSPAKRL